MPKPLIKFSDLKSKWNSVKTAIDAAQRADKDECNAAKKFADWHNCKDTDDLVGKADKEIGEVDTLVTEVDGLIMGLQTMDVVASLLSKRDNWSTLKTNIESIKTDVDGLTNETWVGKAKDQYLKLLPTQSNSLVEMAGLAKSQSTACDNVALINAQMFVAVKDGLSQLWDYANANRNSRAIDWGAETIGGVNWQDQQYVFRSRTLEAKLLAFRDWLTEQSDADLADWSNPSSSLNSSLNTLTSGTTNLQANGVWPGIGIVAGQDASNTGNAGKSDVSVTDPTLNQEGGYYSWD